jgi:glutamine amidotransferase
VIALLDYRAGNLTSVGKALAHVGADFVVTNSPRLLRDAAAVVVPGVGNFVATEAIEPDIREALQECARAKPLLGVCLGLQFLFDGSEEAPGASGLGVIRGQCAKLPPTQKVPHVGWNSVAVVRDSRILKGIADQTSFYFTHSYAAPVTSACVGRTDYTAPFAAAVEDGLVFGVQFHPEKSGEAGLRVLENFVSIVRAH